MGIDSCIVPVFVPLVQVSPVRPPHIGEIYRRQKQRSFHGTTLSNGGIGGQSVNGADQERRLSGDLESTVDKLRSLLEQREQRQNSSTESKNSSMEHAQQSLSLPARYWDLEECQLEIMKTISEHCCILPRLPPTAS